MLSMPVDPNQARRHSPNLRPGPYDKSRGQWEQAPGKRREYDAMADHHRLVVEFFICLLYFGYLF